jgi:hypothetical protein
MPDGDRAVAALKTAKSIVFLLVLVFQRRTVRAEKSAVPRNIYPGSHG